MFQPGKGFKEVQVLLTPDPKVALITSGYHGFVVDVDSGKILHKLNSALPKYSKNAVTVTKRNGTDNYCFFIVCLGHMTV